MRTKKYIGVTAVLFVLVCLCTVAACQKKDGTGDGVKASEPETKFVETVKVEREKVLILSELSGTLQPSKESNVSFEVPGRITEMRCKEGDYINKGHLMAVVDATQYSLQVTEGKTALEKARVAYRQAADQLSRVEQLYDRQAVSQVEYENTQHSFQLAQEDYFQALHAYALIAQGSVPNGLTTEPGPENEISLAPDRNLLKSPVGGTVMAKLSTEGQMIDVGVPVYRVGRVNPLKVLLPVPDREISSWHVGDVVTLFLYDDKREGKVVRIFPATNRGTGMINVEITVPNPKQNWYPGQVVNAARKTAEKEGLFILVQAVLNRGEEKPYVFLAVDGKAVKRAVTTGGLFDNRLEITAGLKEGDRVVVKGADRLFDGDLIKQPGGAKND